MNATTPTVDRDELELWRAWAEHRSDSAAEELWRRSQALAVAVAARSLRALTNPRERARELVDDAFVRALRSFEPERASTRTDQPFRAWFLRLVRSAAIDLRRRVAREPTVVDLTVHADDDPQGALDARIDARRMVARLEDWNRACGLEEDWPVLVAWLQCRHDGVRVPWKSLAAAHPVRPPPDVGFAAGAATVGPEDRSLAEAARKLQLCPRLSLAADGGHEAPEPAALARERSQWVVDTVLEAVEVRRVRREGRARLRLERGPSTEGARRVRFRTTGGERRSPDALRMRVEKVILGKVLSLVKEGRS